MAPAQTIAVTGLGPTQKGKDSHPTPPRRVPPPPSGATTGPKGSQSVNYNSQQGDAPAVTHLGSSGRDYADVQQQQLQDKGGA
jgi:hypothetical protein